jgi:hypothetical protein
MRAISNDAGHCKSFFFGSSLCLSALVQEAEQRIALFAQSAEPLPIPTGILTRDHTHIADHCFAISEPTRIPQEYVYKKEGSKYLQHFLARQKKEHSD